MKKPIKEPEELRKERIRLSKTMVEKIISDKNIYDRNEEKKIVETIIEKENE